jgi:hypothetical protein
VRLTLRAVLEGFVAVANILEEVDLFLLRKERGAN